MKYIRTPDGRFFKGDNYGFGVGMPYKNYDVKVADTVEELCDEFVSNNKLLEPKYIYTNESLIESWRNRFEDEVVVKGNKDIKGGVWTDEGLIYKAKMKGISPNGEIDWELL